MFARHYHHRGPSHVSITERRAPTDESVRLLKEMEQAAQAKITEAMHLDGNVLNGVLQFMEDPVTDLCWVYATFDLNGHRMTSKFSLPRRRAGRVEMLRGLRDEMAKTIASELLVDLVRHLPQ